MFFAASASDVCSENFYRSFGTEIFERRAAYLS